MANTPQEQYLRANLYRGLAKIFLIFGLMVTMVLYIQNVEGQIIDSLMRPIIVVTLLIPLLPCMMLNLMAGSAEKKYRKMVDAENKAEEEENGDDKDDKKKDA